MRLFRGRPCAWPWNKFKQRRPHFDDLIRCCQMFRNFPSFWGAYVNADLIRFNHADHLPNTIR